MLLSSVVSVIPYVLLAIWWGGPTPDNTMQFRYLDYGFTFHAHAFNLYISLVWIYGFPLLLLGGIKNGETTGTLDEAFKRLGDYFDGEVKRTVQILLSNIEPITIFVLGGVFGLIILSILLPLYDVMGELGKSY